MKNNWKKLMICAFLVIALVIVLFLNQSPLKQCKMSPYKVEDYGYNKQKYIIASYPLSVYDRYWSDTSAIMVLDYAVEKKDGLGNYRTVYDSSRDIIPIEEALVVENPYSIREKMEMTLQPLVDIYGEGEYRILHLGRSMSDGSEDILARQYYVISGEHLTNKDNFSEVFGITKKDLENLEIRNGQVTYDLTEKEREEFIDLILNLKLASVNKKTYNDVVMCLAGAPDYGYNYRFVLNLPEEESYIYSMTGKDLDGNSYQAVFVCGSTAVCLDSEENLLYMLDALKQKHNQTIQ